MTDEQIEAAARKLCEIRGVDPEQVLESRVAFGGDPARGLGTVTSVSQDRAWRLAADEIRRHLQVREAVHFVESDQTAMRVGDRYDTRLAAPWRDFAGALIREGDTIRHPTGDTATVVIDRARGDDVLKWRAVYKDGESLWLGNQIGDKGRAVVVPGST